MRFEMRPYSLLLVLFLFFSVDASSQALRIDSVSPSSGAVGTEVTILGSGFGATRGTSTMSFGATAATTYSSWSDTQVVAIVPNTSGGTVKATVGGLNSNTDHYFVVPTPRVDSVTPSSGVVGTQITVGGSGFQPTRGSSQLKVNGFNASIVSWSDTEIVGTVPAGAKTGPIQVWVNSGSNTDVMFSMPRPQVGQVTPASGPAGTAVTITGSGFGATQGSSTATIGGVALAVTSWSDTQIIANIPATAVTNWLQVNVGGVASNATVYFTVPPPRITSISPILGPFDTQVTITGSGFQSSSTNGDLRFNNYTAPIVSWSDTQIIARVPTFAGGKEAPAIVTINGAQSNRDAYFYVADYALRSVFPNGGPVGTEVTINGLGFGGSQGSSALTFNGVTATEITSWSQTQIVARVPSGASSGPVRVRVNDILSNSDVSFTVSALHVSSVVPNRGPVGTEVTISGIGFGATQGTSTLTINNTAVTQVATWSDTQIVATVPSTTTGAVKVNVAGVNSNTNVTYTVAGLAVYSLSTSSGSPGTTVTLYGTGFGSSQGTSTVYLGGYTASVSSWSLTAVSASVPSGAVGRLAWKIRVAGVDSNADNYFDVIPPRIDTITPSSGNTGTQVTISGTGFGATKGSSYVAFQTSSSIATAATSSWSDTQIVATVPSTAVSGPVYVTVNNASSNKDVVFTLPNPRVEGVSPGHGPVGTSVTITGSGFGASQGTSTLTFNSQAPASITSWSDTQIVAVISNSTTTGPVRVTVGGVLGNWDYRFNVLKPVLDSMTPASGDVGTQVTITGSGFQAVKGNGAVWFTSGRTASVINWSDTQIIATAPAGAVSGNVFVRAHNSDDSNQVFFTLPSPRITSVTPGSGKVEAPVTIAGVGFRSAQGSSTLTFNNQPPASIQSWTDTQIVATPNTSTTTGPVRVTVGGVLGNADYYFTVPKPRVSAISPTSGPTGTALTISGSGFQNQRGTNGLIGIGSGTTATPTSWTDTQIVLPIFSGATTGAVKVKANNGDWSNADVPFALSNVRITSVSPGSGPVGQQVTVTGSGFGTSQGTSTLKFNGTSATQVGSWSDTQIVANVPTGATSGSVLVTVAGLDSNPDQTFSIAGVRVQQVSPASGPVGTQVTITGERFGATQGTSTITFNGQNPQSIVSWSDTTVVAVVPTTARTGAVLVTVDGSPSNADVVYTVPTPVVASITPTSGPTGTALTITGSGFQQQRGSGSVLVGTTAISTITSWADDRIVVAVPESAATGAVKVQANNLDWSNTDVIFSVSNIRITTVTPSAAPSGQMVFILGSGFGATKGTSTLKFNGTLATQIPSWTSNQITAITPLGIASGSVVVTVAGLDSNNDQLFTALDSHVQQISPTSGVVGTEVTVTGYNFGVSQGTNSIKFNGVAATEIVSWVDDQIRAKVPSGARTGGVQVTVSGVNSNNDLIFTMPNPVVSTISPTSGAFGTEVTVSGSGFGASQGTNTVSFGDLIADNVTSWTDTQIVTTTPSGTRTGAARVIVGGVSSNTDNTFTVPNPTVSSVTPDNGLIGAQVTIAGTNFGAPQTISIAKFNGVTAAVSSWTDTQIVTTVPAGARSGPVTVLADGLTSNADVAFALPEPIITAVSPSSGISGSQVTVTGSRFGTATGNALWFGSLAVPIVSWTDTQIVATVPSGAGTVPVSLAVDGMQSNDGFSFSFIPQLVSLTPDRGSSMTSVTLVGDSFGEAQGASSVTFGSQPATVSTWSNGQLVVEPPYGLTAGPVPVQVTVAGLASNTLSFTYFPPLLLTPNEVTMLVGERQPLQVLEVDGSEIATATWEVSNLGLAEIVEEGGQQLLQANAVGELTLTATYLDRTGEMKVNIIALAAGETMPPGTVRWSAPPLPGTTTNTIIQSIKIDENTPDLYVGDWGGANSYIRAFSASGNQRWVWPPQGQQRAAEPIMGDNSGGIIAFNEYQSGSGARDALSRIDQNGNEAWRRDLTMTWRGSHAVHPDGTIFILDQGMDASLNRLAATVTALDPITGNPKFTVTLPTSTYTWPIWDRYTHPDPEIGTYDICVVLGSTEHVDLQDAGKMVIDSAGVLYLPFVTSDEDEIPSCQLTYDTQGHPNPGTSVTYSSQSQLRLLKVFPDGTHQISTLDTLSTSGDYWSQGEFSTGHGAIVPDGGGGVLLTGNYHPALASPWEYRIYQSSGSSYPAPVPQIDGLLLGESGVAFAKNSDTVKAFQVADGTTVWSQSGSYDLIAALSQGGALIEGGPLGGLTHIDSAGATTNLVGGVSTSFSTQLIADYWLTKPFARQFGLLVAGLIDPPIATEIKIERWKSGNKAKQSAPQTLRERAPKAGEELQTNYNAILLVTSVPAQQIFDEHVRDFADSLAQNSIAQVIDLESDLPVDAVGDNVRFRLATWRGIFQWPFTVRVKRYLPNSYEFSIVTLDDHPLAGWRFWRVKQFSATEVLIETGSVDKPVGVVNDLIGNTFFGDDQIHIWRDYLLRIQQLLGAPRSSNANYGEDKVNGVWEPADSVVDHDYILEGICGPQPGGFCRP